MGFSRSDGGRPTSEARQYDRDKLFDSYKLPNYFDALISSCVAIQGCMTETSDTLSVSSPDSSGDSLTSETSTTHEAETGTESGASHIESGRSEGRGNTHKSQIELAMDRVLAAREDTSGKRQTGDSLSSSGQAASASAQGDSTSTNDTDTPDSGENGQPVGTSGQSAQADDSTSSGQSLTPPDSWPEDRRTEFDALPANGKALLMSIHKDMERGLKQSFDKLATERNALKETFGLESDQLKSLAERAKTFQTDPVTVISQLAEEAGIDVYFQDQEANQAIPEFDTQEELVKWLQEQSRKEARQAAANETKTLREQRQLEETKAKVQQEFDQAYKAHPDLADHKDVVIQYISGFNLPVEMAYRLATYEGLAKLAQQGQGTQANLDKSKAELERLQKFSTMPPGRPDGRSQKQQTNGMDQLEAAYNRALKSLGRQ